MNSTYYKIEIAETARNNPKHDDENDHLFNNIVETIKDIDGVKRFLTEHYGKMPKMRKKMYHDPNDEEIGFIHSFWNKDFSRNNKSWWQTDWVTIKEVTEKSVLL